MPKEVSEYKQSLHFRRHQLSTLNPSCHLDIERNAKSHRIHRKYSAVQQYIDDQIAEADTFKQILRGLLPPIDTRDRVPLHTCPLGAPVPLPSLFMSRDPRNYTTFPNYKPDGYTSEPDSTPYPMLRVCRTVSARRLNVPSSHARYSGLRSIKAIYHLDERRHSFSTLGRGRARTPEPQY